MFDPRIVHLAYLDEGIGFRLVEFSRLSGIAGVERGDAAGNQHRRVVALSMQNRGGERSRQKQHQK